MDNTYRIETVYTLKQPLSHIGESESTTTFLNTVRIMTQEGPKEVFAYTGNAIRGQWRDSGAAYLLDKLGVMVPKTTFHLLFSGGSISGDQSVDVGAVKRLRSVLPFLSIFGGGVGNQILSGKMAMSFALPVCKETEDIIPKGIPAIDYNACEISWRQLTGEIQFSRKDDAKGDLGEKFIVSGMGEQLLLEGMKEEKADDLGDPPTQMRYCVEYMIPGTQLWHTLTITCTELELGALVASIHQWAKNPILGGLSGKGFGAVDALFEIVERDGSRTRFIGVSDGLIQLSSGARDAKEQYDEHLHRIYDEYLEGNKDNLVKLLEAK